MNAKQDNLIAEIENIRGELLEILDGMAQHLDWRPDSDTWSAREVVTHLLNTPPPGVPAILRRILTEEIHEYDLWADQSYLTPEAERWDLAQLTGQLESYFDELKKNLQLAGMRNLNDISVLVRQRNRGWTEPRPAQWLVERLFCGHWREHLVQLSELRAQLGL